MFDIEKARAKGVDKEIIDIMQRSNENEEKEQSCNLHDFKQVKINGLPKYRCKICGCEEDCGWVSGYMRGIEHGKNFRREGKHE